jgi:2-haloacid dehalogenase
MADEALTVAFDVYGTLVDPAGMAEHLRADVGDEAPAFATLWREKQLEYAFRRGLMQHYATFAVRSARLLLRALRHGYVAAATGRADGGL